MGRLLRRRSAWSGGPASPVLTVLTLLLWLTLAAAVVLAVVMVWRDGVRGCRPST